MRVRSLLSAKVVRRILKWTANAIVLVLLLALAYWGHHHHWQIPTFSALVDTEATEATNVTVPQSHDPDAQRHEVFYGSHSDAGVGAIAAQGDSRPSLPIIEFSSPEEVRLAGIKLSPVVRRHMDDFIECHGVVDYDHTKLARLSTRVSGIIWRVAKSEGELVDKGDVLALIDSAKVGEAKAEFLEAAVQCELKEQTLERLRSLGNVIAGRRLVEAEADLRATRIRRINAEQALITLGLPVRKGDYSIELVDQLVANVQFLGLPETIVPMVVQQTHSANLLPLISPLAGVVIRRDVVTGEVVDTSQTLFVVADVSSMWLDLNVRADDAQGLALGQEVIVPIDPIFGNVRGELVWISTEVDSTTRTVQLRAKLPNPTVTGDPFTPRVLRAQSYVNARVRVNSVEQALAVPTTALRFCWREACHVVFVPLADGVNFVARRVRTGITRDGTTQILEGLNEGESVAAEGTRLLHLELLAALKRQDDAEKKPSLARADAEEEETEPLPKQGL